VEAMIQEMIDNKMCPDCHGKLTVETDYINCPCGLQGNPAHMRWCLKVPVFNPAKPDGGGQLHQSADGSYWMFQGYTLGCGRNIKGDYCVVCRSFLPLPVDHEIRQSRARPARVRVPA